jgi:hypothetical protein
VSRIPSAIPPFKELAAALRKTTEHLALALVQRPAAPPDWSEVEWAVARSVAAMQGISVLLANNLRWSGPPAWRSFLVEQRSQSVLRDARIDELLKRLDLAARHAAVACVGLKGTALRALGLYGPGERPMADVDLLVRAADFERIATAIQGLGYVKAFATRRHTVFEPCAKRMDDAAGELVDNPLKIEVHTAVAEPLPIHHVDITAHLQTPGAKPGLNEYPDRAALMLHLLLHAAGNMRAHVLRQIQLHDIATLAACLGHADWQALLVGPRAVEGLWWALPPMMLTARYYPRSIPRDVLFGLRAACPLALRLATDRRALTDVSWSNLRIYAFPGIAWSRTPLEALRFIRSRVLPNRTALAELQMGFRAQPQLECLPWYGISHGQRILRWLFSRPPRVQTMMSVAAVLERTGSSDD